MIKDTFIRLVGAIQESMDKNDKMDEAIAHTMRYMHIHDYNCKEFCYDELFTIINFEQDYRIGSRMEHVEDIITIMETGFIQSEE